ncbi:unnamed protein product [Pieris brassicae]|uniref:Uncharacterized protein n=1 Tax=Pieris brassicae TaxID=7116 RepID=A0A9P0T198_PIEBR|nr:unnamed protein product [Pieris brassicae]
MPACAPEYRFVRSNTDLLFSPRPKRCPHQSPYTLRRSFSSSFSLIPEEQAVPPEHPSPLLKLIRILTWLPRQFLRPLFAILNVVAHPAWKQILLVLPTLWIAASLFIFWKCIQCPLGLLKMVGSALSSSPNKQKTVLISGGSSIQALHLARNFHSAGAKVIAFEIEGQFPLLKYSAAVSKFYTVPRPNSGDPLAYTRSLKEIVQKESIVFYVPVSSSTPAYFDALAKPHLEVIGCQCFVPCARDVVALDDPLELIRVCRVAGLPTPQFWVVASEDDVRSWYEARAIKGKKYYIVSAGARGAKDRMRFVLPESATHFRFHREISAEKPWVIIREPKGEKLMTCTTLKESRAVNNVTCRLEPDRKGLIPQKDEDTDAWVQKFVSCLTAARPMTGHISFRLVKDENPENGKKKIVAIGARVGVSLPYLCQGSKGCAHGATVGKLLNTVLDTREALFVYWDPLPYCAYFQSRSTDDRRPPTPEPCKTPPHAPN